MSRTLITKHNYRDFLDPDKKEINVCHTMILTPGATDSLREQKIKIIYENQKKEHPEKKCEEKAEECPLTKRIYLLMKEEFCTDDYKLAQKIADLIAKK